MENPYRSLDTDDLASNRIAWVLLLIGGGLGGTLTYALLHHRPLHSAAVIYLALFWAAPAMGMTAIVTRLFFVGPDRVISIARRYRRWKPVWAVMLLIVGACTGAIALLALWGAVLWLATL